MPSQFPRSVTFAIGLLCLLFCGGCAVPRALHMQDLVDRETRIPPGGTRTETHLSPWFTEPCADTTITAPLDQAAAFAWYKDAMTARGWTFNPDYHSVNGEGGQSIRFERTVRWVMWFGSLAPEAQTMRVFVTPTGYGATCRIDINVYCTSNYIWDIPTKLAFLPFYWGFGEEEFYQPLFLPF